MQNISEAIKVIDVAADVGNVLDKVIADKGSVLSKASHLLPLTGDLLSLAGTDFAALKAQLASAGAEEKAALVTEFKAKFDLADDAVEAKIEEGLSLALAAEALVEQILAFSKSLKAAPTA